MTGRLLFVLMLLSPALSRALVIENGTLTGFLMDTCATCAYDNWQSHVSERIQRPGYNDYGPPRTWTRKRTVSADFNTSMRTRTGIQSWRAGGRCFCAPSMAIGSARIP
ncbi:MAG: hypothetical protein IPH10_08370 [bacterium]|nr:hypothetical protein [bacterium]